jgi:hypothetical protein
MILQYLLWYHIIIAHPILINKKKHNSSLQLMLTRGLKLLDLCSKCYVDISVYFEIMWAVPGLENLLFIFSSPDSKKRRYQIYESTQNRKIMKVSNRTWSVFYINSNLICLKGTPFIEWNQIWDECTRHIDKEGLCSTALSSIQDSHCW